jgi:N-acetylglucosaminyldiphosphoundecaprenol N-acetyl-beta-D-mannosaminyltransferase
VSTYTSSRSRAPEPFPSHDEVSIHASTDPYPSEVEASAVRPVRRSVLGVPLDACSVDGAVREIESWVDQGRGGAALYVNAHLFNLIWDDPALAAVFERSTLNYADGMAVVWAARLLGHTLPERVPLTYAIDDLAANWDARGFSVFFLGGAPERAEAAAERLTARFPGIRVAGTHHGYFEDDESTAIVDLVNEARPDILLVGLGNPRQEIWVAENMSRLTVAATLTCGGLFDWVSGARRPAPRWVGTIGMEWLYRLIIEPRRLFSRYFVGNPRFLWTLGRAMATGNRAVLVPLEPTVEPHIVIDLRDGVPDDERMRIAPPAHQPDTGSDRVIDLTDQRTSEENTASVTAVHSDAQGASRAT